MPDHIRVLLRRHCGPTKRRVPHDQRVLFVEADRKRQLLAELFADGDMKRTLVFTRTKRGADRVAKYLNAAGVEAASIHGDKTQGQRERALLGAGAKRGGPRGEQRAAGADRPADLRILELDGHQRGRGIGLLNHRRRRGIGMNARHGTEPDETGEYQRPHESPTRLKHPTHSVYY